MKRALALSLVLDAIAVPIEARWHPLARLGSTVNAESTSTAQTWAQTGRSFSRMVRAIARQ